MLPLQALPLTAVEMLLLVAAGDLALQYHGHSLIHYPLTSQRAPTGPSDRCSSHPFQL